VQYLVSACIISKFLAVAYKIKRSKKKNAFMLQLKIYHKWPYNAVIHKCILVHEWIQYFIPGLKILTTFDWLKAGHKKPIFPGVARPYYRV
jgi:hypothetical protein